MFTAGAARPEATLLAWPLGVLLVLSRRPCAQALCKCVHRGHQRSSLQVRAQEPPEALRLSASACTRATCQPSILTEGEHPSTNP